MRILEIDRRFTSGLVCILSNAEFLDVWISLYKCSLRPWMYMWNEWTKLSSLQICWYISLNMFYVQSQPKQIIISLALLTVFKYLININMYLNITAPKILLSLHFSHSFEYHCWWICYWFLSIGRFVCWTHCVMVQLEKGGWFVWCLLWKIMTWFTWKRKILLRLCHRKLTKRDIWHKKVLSGCYVS